MMVKWGVCFIMFLCGCGGNGKFLDRFKDKGELTVELVREVDKNFVENMHSALKVGNHIVWNKYHSGQEVLFYVFDLDGKVPEKFKKPLKDPRYSGDTEFLYEYNDSVFVSFNDHSQSLSYVQVGDSLRMVDSCRLTIANENSYGWAGRVAMRSICLENDSLFFVGRIGTKNEAYGVYDRRTEMLYASSSCTPPSMEDTKCLFPDNRLHCHVVAQRDGSRYAVFRNSYQLYDVLEINGISLQFVKRCVYHHTPLTWRDQYNLGKDLTHCFFPGFFVQSSRYVMTLYQSEKHEEGQFLLVIGWDGTPLCKYRFPKNLQVDGMCGNEEEVFYALGRNDRGEAGLYRARCCK